MNEDLTPSPPGGSAAAASNKRVLERLHGVPGKEVGALEAMSDPSNPNVIERNDNQARPPLPLAVFGYWVEDLAESSFHLGPISDKDRKLFDEHGVKFVELSRLQPSAAAASRSREPVPVTGIHLVRLGDYVIVKAEIDGQWVEVIREWHDGSFSHIVEPLGMRRRQADEIVGATDNARHQ